jgi:muramoyltetrapeptide carboxypeptidase
MKFLSPLQAGDLVDVVAPGSSCKPDEIKRAVEVLHSWGLRARLPELANRSYLYHAQTDEVRLKLLKDALFAKDSAAVWCLRGGYGSNRLIPHLPTRAPSRTKLFVGLSDITSVQLFLTQVWKWPSLHGPVLARLGSGDLGARGKKEIRQLVFGELEELEFLKMKALNSAARSAGRITGEVTGGNLMTLQSAIGTPFQMSAKNRLVFLEEVSERGYRVDRMLYHLLSSGSLKGAKAILLGEFVGGEEPGSEKKNFVKAALQRFAEDVSVPVFGGLPVGHGYPQRTMPFGTPAVIQKNNLHVKGGVRT